MSRLPSGTSASIKRSTCRLVFGMCLSDLTHEYGRVRRLFAFANRTYAANRMTNATSKMINEMFIIRLIRLIRGFKIEATAEPACPYGGQRSPPAPYAYWMDKSIPLDRS